MVAMSVFVLNHSLGYALGQDAYIWQLRFPIGLILAGFCAVIMRGKLGGEYMLAVTRRVDVAERPKLWSRAETGWWADRPGSWLYRYFGPSKLAKFELERLLARKPGSTPPLSCSRHRDSAQPQQASAFEVGSITQDLPTTHLTDKTTPPTRRFGYGEFSWWRASPELWALISGIAVVIIIIRGVFFTLAGFVFAFAYYGRRRYQEYAETKSAFTPLVLDAEGIEMVVDGKPIRTPWREVRHFETRVVQLHADRDADGWLQIHSTRNGVVSLRLNLIDYGTLEGLRRDIEAWRAWAHARRLRIAMGEV